MQSEYNIYFQDDSVGKATITLQGLYYCMSGFCYLEKGHIYELVLLEKNVKKSLGVLVPENGRFIFSKKIPMKSIQEDISFCVIVRSNASVENFYAVKENKVFPYIDRLENAIMKSNEGEVGVCFLK